ncbi:hypothetical protein AA11825_2196 [Acetobacter pomorum DSM 11825]|nr:hypothetical protein AA11825_2196 [Acetobacter pomorum DSM 11825]
MCRINRGPPLKDIRAEWYHSQALKFGGKSPWIYEVAIDSCTGTCGFKPFPKEDGWEKRVMTETLINAAECNRRLGEAFIQVSS